ncbi:solute carrier family 49 member 4 homolog [Chelonus insularis]|uniref:solute carrier family 49 member 4 homolog n=1 Tax=Chelonus insularis TaxID=460826 RepID=UPI00158A01CC|nr:solute carrier family 49 member 4 homolog [Chelonus insularis]
MVKSNQSFKNSQASRKLKKLKQKLKQRKEKKERKLRPRISSARHSRQYTDIILSDLGEGKTLLIHDEGESWRKRWAALGLFCALSCTQCCVWNTWGPIAKSVMEAFPTWNKTSVALLCNWGCITYLTCCLPCCWFLNETDLAIPLKLAAILSTIATFIRCISARDVIFTTMAHLAAIFNGLAGVIIGPATALVSAVWFSAGERTTATGISSAFSQLGMAISYVLGPALVGDPPHHHKRNKYNFHLVEVVDEPALLSSEKALSFQNITIYQTLLRIQIMSLMRIEFVIQAMVLIGVLFCFPKQSQISSSNIQVSTLGLWESLTKLIKHKSMWCLCLSAALTQGMTGPWLGMITMAFGNAITQDEADKLAFWTVIVSSILSLLASRVTDMFQGHLKIAIGSLLITSAMMFLWIILLDSKVLVFHKDELYAAVILGIATNWSTPALFLELASEIAFPISEAIVGGYMIFLSNIVGTIFYLSYCIPGMEGRWSTCLVFSNIVVGAIFIFYVEEQYNRTQEENKMIPLINERQPNSINE